MVAEKDRYEYWEDSDTAYDTKIQYGQYFRIIDKRDMVYLLNEQDVEIKRLNYLVKIATSLIEWNTVPQIRREWQKHLSKVGDVE